MQISADAIYNYFNQNYGEVKHVFTQSIPFFRFATVTFAAEETARMAFEEQPHTIAGHVVNVSLAGTARQQFNLLSLNDKCLSKLFQFLDLEDLTSMASNCTRLRDLAQDFFTSNFKNKLVSMNFKAANNVENCLRHFGSQIQSIRFDPKNQTTSNKSPDHTHFLHLLQKYCGSLKKLEMRNCTKIGYYTESKIQELAPLFSQLDEFTLVNCGIYAEMFAICTPTQVTLNDVRIYSYDAQNGRFNRLTTLKNAENSWSLRIHFQCFEEEPKCVEHIEMDVCWKPVQDSGIFLRFYKDVLSFENTKTLKVYNSHELSKGSATEILENLPHLSEMVWGYPSCFTPGNLLEIIRLGQNLRHLIVILSDEGKRYPTSENNVADIDEIVDIVSQRSGKLSLNVVIVGRAHQIRPFNVSLPALAPLKITSLLYHQVQSILNVENYHQIKMSNEEIQVLRDNGMF